MGIIYSYTNTINNKKYIGQTINEKVRKQAHRRLVENQQDNECVMFYRAVRKYGWDVFTYEVLEECEDTLLNEREQYYIKFYNTFGGGYNCSAGGGGSIGRKHSEETKQKLSEMASNRPGRKQTEETKQKIREARANQVFSDESKKKMSESAKGRKHSEESKAKMSAQRKGRKHSPETLEKIRQAALNRKKRS